MSAKRRLNKLAGWTTTQQGSTGEWRGKSIMDTHSDFGAPLQRNHYGSKSKRGTEVAALFYSLIETARLRGEDPGHYLQFAALAAIESPGTVTLPKRQD
jgi:hypothetical protein